MDQAKYFGYSGERVKGLIFCSRIEEARELSRKFNEHGWRTMALSGADSEEERARAIERLTMDVQSEDDDYLDYLITVDIFSEGTDIVEVNQEVLELVPAGSSLANLYAGEYTVKQIMEAMLVPSGNDAAYALAYHIAKNELGEGYTATEYIDYFMTELSEYLIEAGYSKTNLYNDPSGASMQADSHLDDINRVALKLLNYDFVKECIGKSEFSIQTPQGEFTWKNTNEFLDENSPYYNANVKGMKTGTMASSYNIVVLYEKDGKAYLITCLAAHSNEGRYKAVQSAINTIIE